MQSPVARVGGASLKEAFKRGVSGKRGLIVPSNVIVIVVITSNDDKIVPHFGKYDRVTEMRCV